MSRKQNVEEYKSPTQSHLHKSFTSPYVEYESPYRSGHYCRKHSHTENLSYSPTRTRQYSEYNPRNPPETIPKYEHTLNHADEKELVIALNNLLEMEDDLEKYRTDLSLKPDFNLLDLFRMFDIENKGYITFEEFRSGLYLFHLYPGHEDALLLFTRYETVSKGILNYTDFCDIFCPKSEEYSSILRTRPSYYIHKPYYRVSEYFHPETRGEIEHLLRTNLRVESSAETIRDHLSLIPSFNVMEAFNTVDMKNDGFLKQDQFKQLLEAHGIYTKSCDLLVDRFDKSKDGKVTYAEFADGLRKY